MTDRIGLWLTASASVLAATMIAAPAQAQDQTMEFHIEAQPMDKALNALSEQSGVRVLFPYDQAAGLTAHAVNGKMPAREALRRLIDRTPLKISLVQKGLIALSSASASSTPTSKLLKVSAADAATPAPPAVVAANANAVSSMAALQTTASVATAPAAPPPTDIIVTGVRGRPRTVTDSPTPIDVLSASELQDMGHAGVISALDTLVPSFNQPMRAGGGTATVIATGGLRGLNPDQTLVLVNGKRRHKTALINAVSSLYNGSVPTDLDMIPEAGIARVEVLRDGAAAQYGSDAIAGVINIILKDTPGGFISGTSGANFDRGDGQFLNTGGSYGMKVLDKGFLDVFFNTRDQAQSNRANPILPSVQLYPTLTDPRQATANRLVTKNYGQLPQGSYSLGYNGHYDYSDNIQIYAFGTFTYRDTDLPYTFRSADNVNSLPQIYPNGFRPNLSIFEDDFQFVEGATGTINGWTWDLSTSYGLDYAAEYLNQSLNASLGPTSPTAFNTGALQSTEWDNSLDVTRDFKNTGFGDLQTSFGLQHRQETYTLFAGAPASYVAGTYVIPAGQPFAGQRPQTGAQAAPGIQPADASDHSRNNYAAYAELGWTPIQQLFLDGAVRYEDFDDSSGSSVIGKLDGRYQVADWIALRAAVSNGFRAPSLAQEYFSSTSSQFQLVNNQLNLLLIKTLPVDSPQAKALGSEPLRPETSRNYSAGVTLTPVRNLTVTLDGYRIDVDKRIALTSTLTGTAVSNILVANGLSGALSAQYYTNAINTETQGVDLVATYRRELWGYGSARFSLGANYNDTKITHIIKNPPQLSALGPNYVLFDRASQGYLTTALPKTKVATGVVYTLGQWEVTWRETRYGGYDILQDTPSSDRTYGPKWITDLEVAYHLNKSVALALGATNLGNVYPSPNGIYNATIGSGQYPGTSPFGFTGGFYYGRVSWSF